ncbi:Mss4-like protein [Xylogone sp. PMI_703]|nr:Mss4-like protein [Xylogone sp. PMI_703]
MAPGEPGTTTRMAYCSCRTHSLKLTYQNETLPMPQLLCLCTTCRLITGGPAVAYIDVPPSTAKTLDGFYSQHISNSKPDSSQSDADTAVRFEELKPYDTSPGVTRYFCTTCGSHVLCRVAEPAISEGQPVEWVVATGIVDRLEDVVDWKGTYWVGDTLDGGIAPWLSRMPTSSGDAEVKWKNLERQSADKDASPPWEHQTSLLEPDSEPGTGNRSDTLSASCLCKSIQFTITRPNDVSSEVFSPYPDLMIPYHLSGPTKNPSKETWFLRANKTKYLAGLCTCPTCRLALGMPIQSWAFVPRCNILLSDGSALDFEKMRPDGLTRFSSTEDTYREFCGKCGATVFWHCGWRPGIIDVSTGLLDPSKGARCESWLEWWSGRVSFREIGNDGRLADALEAGLKDWEAERGKK